MKSHHFKVLCFKLLVLYALILLNSVGCKKNAKIGVNEINTNFLYVYPPNTYAHDPSMIKQDSIFYLFYTGDGIQCITSKDMFNWSQPQKIFDTATTWMTQKVTGFNNFIWAPDISYYNGMYYLFYAVSSFGINNSAIGLATNTTLHTNDSAYHWVDHGKIIESYNNVTVWNAIDPNLITDADGNPWLVFGSFYTGIHIVRLAQNRLSVGQDISDLPILASRSNIYANWNPANGPGGNNIEGSVIYKHANYYYLFASVDVCCQGINSTYKIIVGRSINVNGPYYDDEDKNMASGGQLLLLASDNNWHGVGGESVYRVGSTDYISFHAYDVHDNGVAKLRIEPITWTADGWPYFENAY